MANKVTGYLSRDDNFFATEAEANKHDAEMDILTWCTARSIKGKGVIEIVEALADPIMEYINASQEVRDTEQARRSQQSASNTYTPEADQHSANDGFTEEELEAIQQLANDGPQPVSDVGGDTCTEVVLNKRKGNGPRRRRDNA